MARTRAALTDKQEKIVIQCQLMGMTTADMVTISNRLKALDAEREFRVRVSEVIEGKTWEKKSSKHYIIKDSDGLVYDCTMAHKVYDHWNRSERWTVSVTHPGTRMKEKVFKDQSIYASSDEQARVCPDNDKKLFRLMRAIDTGKFS